MNMKWKRSIALLLIVCTVVSLMGTAAFAAASDGAVDTGIAAAAAADGTSTSDNETGGTPAGDGEQEGGENNQPVTITLRFYDYSGALVETIDHTSGEKITEAELTQVKASTAYPTEGVAQWLYGTDENTLSAGGAESALTELAPSQNYVFYAAYLVSYYKAAGELLSSELVRKDKTPTRAPTALADNTPIIGWVDENNQEVKLTGDDAWTANGNLALYAQVSTTNPTATYTVTFYDYDGTQLKVMEDVAAGSKLSAEDIPVSVYKKNTLVSCWLVESDFSMSEYTPETLAGFEISGNANIYAAWCVTYYDTDGETALSTEYVLTDHSPLSAPVVTDGGKSIAGWLDATGKSVTLSEQKIICDGSYTAWVRPSLNTDPTLAYVNGSAEGSKIYRFLPTGSLTRAEAAQMIYNLLGQDDRAGGPLSVNFSDVSSGIWYAKAINTLASYGILNGTGAGKFEPNAYITRGQFVTMVSRLFPSETYTGESPFVDVQNKNTTYYNAVMMAAAKGWINGYATSSGSYFYPQNQITRAEAVKILSGVLGRNPTSETSKAKIDSLDGEIFIDILGDWAYYWIMDAATGGGTNVPSTGFSAGRYEIGGSYYFVDSRGCFVYETRGVHKMTDGKYYFFKADGVVAPKYTGGLRTLNSKLYLLDSDGSIIHEPKSNYDTRVYEYNNYLYYINEDGSLAQNTSIGPLYFDKNGRYTSGDSTLDSWVWGFLSDILQSSKSQEEKLYAAYVKMRDFPLERYGDGRMGYGIRGNLKNMTYVDVACHYFQYAQGDCSAWASAFVYVARRIGYQAWIAEGKLGTGAAHAWEVIEIGGTKYTFDVEQEWGFMYKYYSPGNTLYKDCWKMTYAPGETIYYGYRFSSSYYAGRSNGWSPYYYSTILGLW